MARVCFHEWKRVHTRLSEKDRTQGLTRRNRGCFGWGRYHYPRTIPHVSETLRGRVSEWRTLPLFSLGRRRSRRTQRAFGTAMSSCASLPHWAAWSSECVIDYVVSINLCLALVYEVHLAVYRNYCVIRDGDGNLYFGRKTLQVFHWDYESYFKCIFTMKTSDIVL